MIPRSLPGSSVHGILQARILEWTAISFSYTHTHTHTHKTKSLKVTLFNELYFIFKKLEKIKFSLYTVITTTKPHTFKKLFIYLAVVAHRLLSSCGAPARVHELSCPMTCGILIPPSGIESISLALEVDS